MTENRKTITIVVPGEIDGEPIEVAKIAAREFHRATVELLTAAHGVYRQLRNAALDTDREPSAEKVKAWESSTQGLLARKAVERATQLARSADLLSRRVHGRPVKPIASEMQARGEICEL